MKSKRSKACEFSAAERKAIADRDGYRCIFCGRMDTTYAHYIPRSKGGLGIRQNGVLACWGCHHEMDNGYHAAQRIQMIKRVSDYLEAHYSDFTDSQRIYKKGGTP